MRSIRFRRGRSTCLLAMTVGLLAWAGCSDATSSDGDVGGESGGGGLKGSEILFTNGADLCGMKADGTGKTVLKAANYNSYDTFAFMTFSPDGTKILYVASCGGKGFLRVMDRSLGAPTDLTTPCGPAATEPAFSPDGTRVAFIASNWAADERGDYLYVMDADGSNPHRVTALDARGYNPSEGSPSFIHDGSRIVYTDNRAGNVVVASINVDGSDYRTFGGGSGADDPVPTEPTVLWPGDSIFYVSAVTTSLDNMFNVYRAALDGSGAVRITASSEASLRRPKPSADGKRVLVTRATSFADQEIRLVDVDTGAETTLSDPAFSTYNDFPIFVP